ncbi:MAG: UDP-2,4-diacetamido-2,4,6-trideoxy-beta-L-altropyranose hydrolase, partial [Rhodocyclales bacterium]|nr:UDP-2,4-diacetamido-2,4,6-trideoxy-beta-L-altropyranose hydrolase [Rhodocyclales bacterium]
MSASVAFRADATNQIGTGHFMRCLTLADALHRNGARIRFVSRGLPNHLGDMLTARGMEFVRLNCNTAPERLDNLAHSNWLGTSQAQDARDTLEALAGRRWDWLVVDHYALDARWESAMRVAAGQIMVIDDLADRQHDCDLLLDQNYYLDLQTRYATKVPDHCRLLLGPRYALLRDEFQKLREQLRARTGKVKRIMVFFGGVDAGNYTGLSIQALSGVDNADFAVDVVIGAQHPRRSEIERACATHGYTCHVQTARMAEIMAAADLSIGAGGSATWERCCLGLPTLSICTAENQRRQVADAAEASLLYAPSGEGDLVDLIRRHTRCLLENASILNVISTAAMKAVDGRGASRIVRDLNIQNTDSVSVRPAVAGDGAVVWPWRNSEKTRRFSFDPSPVSLESHLAWWNRSLANNRRILLIGSLEAQEIGVIR